MDSPYSPDDVLAAIGGIRTRTIGVLRAAGEERAAQIVPTCPDWTAKELACHMYGTCDDLLNGRLEGIGSEAWSQAQVDRHSGKPLDELLDEWAASGDAFDAMVPHIPRPGNYQLVMDMATHEHDIRLAVGSPGAQDDPSLGIGSAYMLRNIAKMDADLAEQIQGSGLTHFECLRSLTGRRSVAQLEASGIDAEGLARFLAVSPMTIVEIDLVEVPTSGSSTDQRA